jgi:hypothetical protein
VGLHVSHVFISRVTDALECLFDIWLKLGPVALALPILIVVNIKRFDELDNSVIHVHFFRNIFVLEATLCVSLRRLIDDCPLCLYN